MSSFRSRAVHRRKVVLAEYATANRRHPTPTEQILWAAIRGGALGVTFRRQVPVGHAFIADFYAAEVRLIVEVDGPIHKVRMAADQRRDEKLARLGYTVLRVPAEVVERELSAAIRLIREVLEERH